MTDSLLTLGKAATRPPGFMGFPASRGAVLETSRLFDDGQPQLLDPRKIKILNWNIQKQRKHRWHRDLTHLCRNVDLALFQEVHLHERFFTCFDESLCRSFAKGYSTFRRKTGVLTLATADHLSEAQVVTREPLLRTPKATNITTYGLAGSDLPLLVVNLHSVNFSLGLKAYQRQLLALSSILDGHKGPIVFAGDFNAWHPARERLLRSFTSHFALEEVEFPEDHRTRRFGNFLDYIFVRGLNSASAEIHPVASSDHNPMCAVLSL